MNDNKETSKYEALVGELLNRLRADLVGPDAFKFACLLLCWIKLSSHEQIPAKYSFQSLKQGPNSSQDYSRFFQDLADDTSLGANRAVFSIDSWLFSRISQRTMMYAMDFASSTGIDSPKTDFRALFVALTSALQNTGRKEGEPYLPTELSDLLVGLTGVSPDKSLYCTHEAALGIAIQAGLTGATENIFFEMKRMISLPFVANILCDLKIEVSFSDPLENPAWVEAGELRQFDCAAVAPPFSVKYDYRVEHDRFGRFPERSLTSEVLDIRHSLAQSRSRVVAVVPLSVLYRPTGGERDFRQNIVNSGWLHTVIALPSGILSNTQIGCAILVLDKVMPRDKIFFVDLKTTSTHIAVAKRGNKASLKDVETLVDVVSEKKETGFSQLVLNAECAKNDFNLEPQRYVLSNDDESFLEYMSKQTTVPLGSICTIVRGQVVDDPKLPVVRRFTEVTISDLNDAGLIDKPKKKVEASQSTVMYGDKQRLFANDVIMSVKGSVGQVGFVTEDVPDRIASQMFVILRPKAGTISPAVLFRYLRSEVGQRNIQRATTGSTAGLLSTKALELLPIILPPLEEAAQVENMHREALSLQKKAADLLLELKVLEKEHWSLNSLT